MAVPATKRPMRLIADSLTVHRGGLPVFSGLSFAVSGGEGLAVTGPNGVGKSTLLRALCGLLKPAGGTVRLEGAEGAAFHYLGHANGLKAALTAAENLGFWRQFLDRPAASVSDALQAVGLGRAAGLPAGQLSAGQKRRLAIARLLVSRRPVWLADEPLSALDAAAEAMFAGLLENHLDEGGIAIVATHQALGVRRLGPLRLGAAA